MKFIGVMKKSSFIVYFVLKILVIVCMIIQIIRGNYNNVLLCLLTLVLFTILFFIQRKFKIILPVILEILILLDIFASTILGEVQNFYNIFSFWDIMLHAINGFLVASIGFFFIDLLNKNINNFNLPCLYMIILAFCFSMTIGVLWEFFEYGVDTFLKYDMQKDALITEISSVALNSENINKAIIVDDIDYVVFYDKNDKKIININGYLDIGLKDTMEDLLVNFLGAVIFCLFVPFFVNCNEKGRLKNFKNHSNC